MTLHQQYKAEFDVWRSARHRCTNPNAQAWSNYGGRGIGMCQRWLDSFEAFLADMGARPSACHSLDRINNDGNYEPGNCRWTTSKEQGRNTRRVASRQQVACVKLLLGQRFSRSVIAAAAGVPAWTVDRIRTGECWNDETTDAEIAAAERVVLRLKKRRRAA